MDRLRDQLSLFMKDPVVARAEIKPVSKGEQPAYADHAESGRIAGMEADNAQLRKMLRETYTTVRDALSELGFDVPEVGDRCMHEPAAWTADGWSCDVQAMLGMFTQYVERVRQTASQCRSLAPLVDASSEIGAPSAG